MCAFIPAERELEGEESRLPPIDERCPRVGDGSTCCDRARHGEEEAGEDDIECLDERGIVERTVAHALRDALRHLAIHVDEHGDAVRRRKLVSKRGRDRR